LTTNTIVIIIITVNQHRSRTKKQSEWDTDTHIHPRHRSHTTLQHTKLPMITDKQLRFPIISIGMFIQYFTQIVSLTSNICQRKSVTISSIYFTHLPSK